MNLSSRLSDYFSNSYIEFQSTRGSAISTAILKHGLSNFSVQILELGPSPARKDISVDSDFILLEQYFLDRYILQYNIRRIALGPAPVSVNKNGINKGETNSQFGKFGVDGAAWNLNHSKEQRALWSLTRTTPIFIYNASTLNFSASTYGYERLANILGVHVNTARRIVKSQKIYKNRFIVSLVELSKEQLKTFKAEVLTREIKAVHVYNRDKSVLLKTFPSVNSFTIFSKQNGSAVKQLCSSDTLWLVEYFLSYYIIDSADNTLNNLAEFNPTLKSRLSIPVYTYSADGSKFIKRYSSLRECVKELEGNRNFNTNTIKLRIKHKELYHGFIVSNTPLFDHPL